MRHVLAMVTVSLLFFGCAQLGGGKPSGGGGKVGTAAAPPASVCQSVSHTIGQLDSYLGQLSQINLCLSGSGSSSCPTKDAAKQACDARDALSNYHTSAGCTDSMLGNRPGLCSRL
jgi:hypothetical protein